MHSMKEKFRYFMKVQKELHDIIYDAMDLGVESVVKMMKKHLESYNSKSHMYQFKLIKEDEFGSIYKFIMSGRGKGLLKPIYQDSIPVKELIRNEKLNSLLD